MSSRSVALRLRESGLGVLVRRNRERDVHAIVADFFKAGVVHEGRQGVRDGPADDAVDAGLGVMERKR